MTCEFALIFFLSREWYSYHFPELVKIVPDNYLYAKVCARSDVKKLVLQSDHLLSLLSAGGSVHRFKEGLDRGQT